MNRAAITAVGGYLPPEILDNGYFAERMETTDSWIRERTGICARHILRSGATSELATKAAQQCLARRGVGAEHVDLVIVATSTPDHLMPQTAALVAHNLGARKAWGYDLVAACSGFVFALVTGAAMVKSGAARCVLVVGADKMSSVLDYEDRNTAIIFGDGAGAVLLEPTTDAEVGIIDHECRMDGSGAAYLRIPAGGSARPATPETLAWREHYLKQDGPTVFRAAVAWMAELTQCVMCRNALTVEQLRYFVPHQANMRIIAAVGRRLGLSDDKVYVNVNRYGNTTAGTVPLCLNDLFESGSVAVGDALVLTAFGAGFSAGSVFLRWALPAYCGRTPAITSPARTAKVAV